MRSGAPLRRDVPGGALTDGLVGSDQMSLQHEVEPPIVPRALVIAIPPEPVAALRREDRLPRSLDLRGAIHRVDEGTALRGHCVIHDGLPSGHQAGPAHLFLLLSAPSPEVSVDPATRVKGAEGHLREARLREEVADLPGLKPAGHLRLREVLVKRVEEVPTVVGVTSHEHPVLAVGG